MIYFNFNSILFVNLLLYLSIKIIYKHLLERINNKYLHRSDTYIHEQMNYIKQYLNTFHIDNNNNNNNILKTLIYDYWTIFSAILKKIFIPKKDSSVDNMGC